LTEAFTAFLATLMEYLRVRYAGAGDRGAERQQDDFWRNA
jgi:hypothetical protein